MRMLSGVVFALGVLSCTLPVSAQSGAKNGEWRSYGGDLGNTHYSPLDQINAGNFSKLQVAWRFKTDNLGPRPEFNFEGTPLMANGVIYSTAGTRRAVVALDAATGELLWVHGEHEGARGTAAPRQLSGRGLAYWTDGREERIFYVTPGYRLVALDAKTGNLVPSFGNGGMVDLKLEDDQEIDLVTGEVGLHAAPGGGQRRRDRGRGAPARRRPEEQDQRQGLRPRIRRANRQAALDLSHHPAFGRIRIRHLGKRFRVLHRQHRRLGPDQRGSAIGDGVYPGGVAHGRLLRRPSPRQRPVRRNGAGGGSENRAAQMALPVGAPRNLGHGYSVRAHAGGHHRQRPAPSRRWRSPPSKRSCMFSTASPASPFGRS